MRSLESEFIEFGIDYRSLDPNLVDNWQRVATSDKPKKRNGAVLYKPDGTVFIQNWATDEKAVWHPKMGSNVSCISQRRSLEEKQILQRQVSVTQADAADLADRIWESAKPARKDHPYLHGKDLPPLELRETNSINGWSGRWLICPLYSAHDPIKKINLECINAVGDKRPIKGALRKAVWGFAGPGMPLDNIIIAEGWSTAAALSVSLNTCVVFAVGKGNIQLVAEVFRKDYPDANITIAADNDKDGGGEKIALQAGKSVGATVIYPNDPFNDFCDVYTKHGADLLAQRWSA